MPYISKSRRDEMEIGMFEGDPQNAGELNYVFTMIATKYIDNAGKNYAHINDVIGALEGAKLEFYRRLAAPYEDTKIVQNGDVY